MKIMCLYLLLTNKSLCNHTLLELYNYGLLDKLYTYDDFVCRFREYVLGEG